VTAVFRLAGSTNCSLILAGGLIGFFALCVLYASAETKRFKIPASLTTTWPNGGKHMKSTRIALLTAVLVSVPATADILSLPTGG